MVKTRWKCSCGVACETDTVLTEHLDANPYHTATIEAFRQEEE